MAEERKYIARLELTGGREARAEAEATSSAVERGTTRMSQAFERAGKTAEGLDTGFKRLNRGVNDAKGAIDILGAAVPGLDKVFGALTTNIGNLSDVFGTLSSLFTKNPIGLAAAGVSAVAAAYVYLTQTAKAAEEAVEAGGDSAAQAAIDWQKLVDPLKAVSGLIDEVKSKQVAVVGGPRAAAEIGLAAKKAELAQLESELRALQEKPFVPGQSNREAAENRDANQARADRIRALRPEIAALTKEIAALEAEMAKLRRLEGIFQANPGEDGNNLAGFRQLDEAREARRKAGAEAAAAEAKEAEQLLARFAPAIKAEGELAAARARAIELARDGALVGNKYEAVLRGIADAEFDATEEGKRAAEVRAFAVRVTEETTTAEERYEAALRLTDEALKANLITEEQAARKRELEKARLEKAQKDTSSEAKAAQSYARELGLTFTSAFEAAIAGGRKASDILRALGQDLLKLSVRKTLTEPFLEFVGGLFAADGKAGKSGGGVIGSVLGMFGLGGSSASASQGVAEGEGFLGKVLSSVFGGIFSGLANGGVLERGAAVPFAAGGIVTRPTLFPMARGAVGLMGEAGPEAVIPLARDRSGRLGVAANGGGAGATPVVVNIDARGSHAGMLQSIRQVVMQELAPLITDGAVLKVEQRANLGGSFSRAVGRRGRS